MSDHTIVIIWVVKIFFSLDGMMRKLKLQYFGHLMWRVDSLEKTLMLGGIGGGKYKKELHDPDNHNGVITHLEPDILECEVKLPLESIDRKSVV